MDRGAESDCSMHWFQNTHSEIDREKERRRDERTHNKCATLQTICIFMRHSMPINSRCVCDVKRLSIFDILGSAESQRQRMRSASGFAMMSNFYIAPHPFIAFGIFSFHFGVFVWLWFASFWPIWERRSDINVRLLTLSEQMNGTKAGDVPSLRHFQEHIFINRTLGGSWHAPNWEGPRNKRLPLQTTHTQPAGEALKSIHAQNLRFKNRQRSDATLNHLNSSIRLFTQKHFIDHEHAP